MHKKPASSKFTPKTNISKEARYYNCGTQITTILGSYGPLSKENCKGSLTRKAVRRVNDIHFDKLYQSGLKQLKKRDNEHGRFQGRLSNDCTFLPKVNNTSPRRNELIQEFRRRAARNEESSRVKFQDDLMDENDDAVETTDEASQTEQSLHIWNAAAIKFQCVWRGFLGRRRYLKKREAFLQWQKEQEKKRREAAIKIQSRYRGHIGRKMARKKETRKKLWRNL